MVKKIKVLEEEVRELKEEIKILSNQKFPIYAYYYQASTYAMWHYSLNAFADTLDNISTFESSTVTVVISAHTIQNKVLPSSINRVRYRGHRGVSREGS